MTTHAPGPYIIVPEAIEHPNGRFRFIATADWDEDAGRGHILARLTDHPQIEGNAHLFAAAPDLLAAALGLVDLIHSTNARCGFGVKLTPKNNPCVCSHHAAYHAARAAIASATPKLREPRNPSDIAQARERGRKLGYDIPRFREEDCGGAFDGNQVISDADPGL